MNFGTHSLSTQFEYFVLIIFDVIRRFLAAKCRLHFPLQQQPCNGCATSSKWSQYAHSHSVQRYSALNSERKNCARAQCYVRVKTTEMDTMNFADGTRINLKHDSTHCTYNHPPDSLQKHLAYTQIRSVLKSIGWSPKMHCKANDKYDWEQFDWVIWARAQKATFGSLA